MTNTIAITITNRGNFY